MKLKEAVYSKKRVIAIILAVLPAAGFGAAVAILSPIYGEITITTTLILALALAAIAFLSICLFSPFIGLILALVLLYNPYFNYIYLFQQGWEGGYIRALISASLIVLIILAILTRVAAGKEASRFRTPLDMPLIIFAIFPLIGLGYGFLQGNETREILAELFPFLEFYSFFFIATFAVKTEKQVSQLLWAVILWGTIAALAGIVMYLTEGNTFYFRIPLGTMVIPRLTDFMPALLLPPLLALTFYAALKRRALLYLPLAVLTIALTFSYFRSLWIGVLASLILILVLVKGPKLKLKRVAALVALTLLALLPMNFLTHHLGFIDEQVTIYEVVAGRALQTVGWELPSLATGGGGNGGGNGDGNGGGNGGGDTIAEMVETVGTELRLQNYRDLFSGMIANPLLGVGLGGTITSSSGMVYLLSGQANYYLGIGCQLGLPAFLFFIGIGIFFFIEGIKRFRRITDESHKALILGILASFVCMGVVLLMFPSLLHFPIPAYLGMGAALLFLISEISKETPQVEEQSKD